MCLTWGIGTNEYALFLQERLMTFKGNIYITDPSYIAKREDWMEGFDPLMESVDCSEFSNSII